MYVDTRSQKPETRVQMSEKIYKGNFEKLIVWRKSHTLVLEVYRITAKFPRSEELAVSSQLRRAAYSVPSNIAEGCSKSEKYFVNHLIIAQGSLEEIKYFTILSKDLGYLTLKESDELTSKTNEVCKMVYALINNLRRKP